MDEETRKKLVDMVKPLDEFLQSRPPNSDKMFAIHGLQMMLWYLERSFITEVEEKKYAESEKT
jgi:hypothetical protein